MAARLSTLSSVAMALMMAALSALPVAPALAHSSASWDDDDRPRHRGKGHHDRGRHHGRGHGHGHQHGGHGVPHPNVHYVPPPHFVYLAPPPRHHRQRVAAYPVSAVYITIGGQPCRDYRASFWIRGMVRVGSCTACLFPDGAWRVLD